MIGKKLLKKMPKLKTDHTVRWGEEGAGENLRLLCELLKGNAIPVKRLDLLCDEVQV